MKWESRVENRRSGFSLAVAADHAFASSPQPGLAWLCFLFPLIEPDRRSYRIRLSERLTLLCVTPSATSEHKPGATRLVVNPHVLRCFLRPSLTEAPSLHRHYAASSVSLHFASCKRDLTVGMDRDQVIAYLA